MNLDKIKELRERTHVSLGVCKKALEATADDVEKAIEWMRKAGELRAADLTNRAQTNGATVAYVHPGNLVAALVQVNCETDFVAKSDDFLAFCKDVAMHVVAAKPLFLEVSEANDTPFYWTEYNLILDQIRDDPKLASKPEQMRVKISDGKMEKRLKEVTLLDQPFIKDPTMTVAQLLGELVLKTGENIKIARMVRYDVKEA
jgi:elongation factor Ts